MPLQIEADSNGAVTTLFPNAKNQRHDLGWNAKPDIVWPLGQIPQTGYPVHLIALLPNIVKRPDTPKNRQVWLTLLLMRCACCSMRSLAFTFLAWICS